MAGKRIIIKTIFIIIISLEINNLKKKFLKLKKTIINEVNKDNFIILKSNFRKKYKKYKNMIKIEYPIIILSILFISNFTILVKVLDIE